MDPSREARGIVLYIQNFNLKEGRALEFQAWMKKNEGAIAKATPRGWKYRGTYAYVLGFGRYGGMAMWECSRYADFDAWREHDDPTWNRLNGEIQDFFTEEITEAVLLREIGDTRILEPPKKPKK
ncbi:MAG TPA: hypothetical protein VIB49_08825 [Thermoplasmata archaeon]|jgi:hypothetical protein